MGPMESSCKYVILNTAGRGEGNNTMRQKTMTKKVLNIKIVGDRS